MILDENDNENVNVDDVKLDLDHSAIMDIQLVYHQGRGALIKEMAFKGLNCGIVYNVNMAHDVKDVPAHLVIKRGDNSSGNDVQRHYHRFTGLDLEAGDMLYNDRNVADMLSGMRVVFLKGANKKATLIGLYDRLENEGSGHVRPTVVNIDGQTADDADRLFCKAHGITLATFSFTFVYTNFNAYLNTVIDLCNTADIIHVNNVLAADVDNYNLFGRGRVICICHSDHSRGGAIKTFGTKQRCSLLNLSILYYLWFGARYDAFVVAARSKSGSAGGGGSRKVAATTATKASVSATAADQDYNRPERVSRKRRYRQSYPVSKLQGNGQESAAQRPKAPGTVVQTRYPDHARDNGQRRLHVAETSEHYSPYPAKERFRHRHRHHHCPLDGAADFCPYSFEHQNDYRRFRHRHRNHRLGLHQDDEEYSYYHYADDNDNVNDNDGNNNYYKLHCESYHGNMGVGGSDNNGNWLSGRYSNRNTDQGGFDSYYDHNTRQRYAL